MTGRGRSRWDDDQAEDRATSAAQRATLKEDKKRRTKKEKLGKSLAASNQAQTDEVDVERPPKRFKSSEPAQIPSHDPQDGQDPAMLVFPTRHFGPCGNVEKYERLNDIEEGSYGLVSRARDRASGGVVALKKLKMDHANDGFPVTGLREIQTLMASRHDHIVHLQEVVTGSTLKDIYLVMDFIEHDLKTLLEDMAEPFLPSEIKTVMLQIISATDYLHSHWILHRDLKTSNLLMNNRGEIKLADFGMARYTSSPPPPALTQLVVTLWYRSPELLLGTPTYGFDIDMWSLGCILGELLTREPLFQGKNEVDQLSKIFDKLGTPTSESWPDFRSLPNAKSLHPLLNNNNSNNPQASRSNKLSTLAHSLPSSHLSPACFALLTALLSLNPHSRPTASEALQHPYFRTEAPRPKDKQFLPTFPSKAGQEKRRRKQETPNAPIAGGLADATRFGADDFAQGVLGSGGIGSVVGREEEEEEEVGQEAAGAGFALRFG